MSKIGDQLKNAFDTIGSKLHEAQMKKVFAYIKAALDTKLESLQKDVKICNQDSKDNCRKITIDLNTLGLTSDDIRDGNSQSKIWNDLQEWSKNESLVVVQKWTHPDCSYCEECSTNCRPIAIEWSW